MGFGNLNNLGVGMLGTGSSVPTATVVSAFSPNNISGLIIWFDATTGVFSDAGITPAQFGQTVAQWNDQSSSGKNMSQVTGSSRPTYNVSVQNGMPGVTFNGKSMFTSNFTLSQPEHVFIVFNQITYQSGFAMFDGTTVTGMSLKQSTTGTGKIIMQATNTVCENTLPIGSPGVGDFLFNGASSFSRMNNGSKVTGNIGAGSGGGLVAGNFGNFSAGANFHLFEILVYNVALSDADAALVSQYLGTKWGILVA